MAGKGWGGGQRMKPLAAALGFVLQLGLLEGGKAGRQRTTPLHVGKGTWTPPGSAFFPTIDFLPAVCAGSLNRSNLQQGGRVGVVGWGVCTVPPPTVQGLPLLAAVGAGGSLDAPVPHTLRFPPGPLIA